ncbi:helix-turn-helix domain-containing protein [Aeromicrobium sp. CnD17-E]|uniref:helix-turn-helix domain-containing protein n=1 Tax=Aeromicrobium sp. CnD17-E TaxID=2954487 RepID=UPI0035AB8692
MNGNRRVGLSASVPPAASLWLLWRVHEELLAFAAAFDRRGNRRVGDELRFAFLQLTAAAEQVSREDLLPRIGSAEGDGSDTGRGSRGGSSNSLSVAEVADGLEVTRRRVRQLLEDGVLAGTQRTRGGTWSIDRRSVEDFLQARSDR